jgi:hypothetical protein
MRPSAQSLVIAASLLAQIQASAAALAQELTPQQRDMIEDAMAPDLVLPETAIYRFDAPKPYIDGATLVCGQVNYQSASRVYTGFHNFYAVVSDGKVTLSQIDAPEDDASGKLHAKIKLLCGRG